MTVTEKMEEEGSHILLKKCLLCAFLSYCSFLFNNKESGHKIRRPNVGLTDNGTVSVTKGNMILTWGYLHLVLMLTRDPETNDTLNPMATLALGSATELAF